jgi:hypothetical protein
MVALTVLTAIRQVERASWVVSPGTRAAQHFLPDPARRKKGILCYHIVPSIKLSYVPDLFTQTGPSLKNLDKSLLSETYQGLPGKVPLLGHPTSKTADSGFSETLRMHHTRSSPRIGEGTMLSPG